MREWVIIRTGQNGWGHRPGRATMRVRSSTKYGADVNLLESRVLIGTKSSLRRAFCFVVLLMQTTLSF